MAKKTFYDWINRPEPTLVDFHATWCGPCKMMDPVIKQLASEMKGRVKVLKVDIDKNQRLAQRLEVMGVPTFIIYQNGEIVWRRSGALTKTKLIKELEKRLTTVE